MGSLKSIYLDNQTTTKPSRKAVEAMTPFFEERWGVASAPHSKGQELLPYMDEAYTAIYDLFGAKEYDNFIFTSSGAEAVNHVAWAAYFDQVRDRGKNHLITSNTDEAPIILAYDRLEKFGCDTTMIPVNNDGIVTVDALADAITPRTALFSIAWANGLTGTIQPVAELAELCRERGIWFHLDATHALGKLAFDLDEIAPDLISFNGDHLHAPKGTGGLWIRSGLRLNPLILGGMEQDSQRAGAVSLPLLTALGVACQESNDALDHVATETSRLRNKLEEGVVALVPDATILFQDLERLPTTSVIAFPGCVSDALLFALNRAGLYASFGGGAFQQLAIQLEAVGISHPLADCAVSFGLSRETTEEEINAAIQTIAETITKLRELWEPQINS